VIGVKGLAVAFRGPKASDGLGGERHCGLVVSSAFCKCQGPLLGSIDWFALLLRELRRQQCRPCAVDQQGAEVAVAAFGRAPQSSGVAAGCARGVTDRTFEIGPVLLRERG
jgi:hypothetical protein